MCSYLIEPSGTSDRISPTLATIASVILLVLLASLSWLRPVLGYAGLGGFVTEKLIGPVGAGSSLVIGTSVDGPAPIVGTAPVTVTGAVTDAILVGAVASATLHGNITSMNNLPSATVHFQWGYTPVALGMASSSATVSATGEYTISISGYAPGAEVYYQAVAEGDGTSYGSVEHFHVGGGAGTAYWILANILVIVIAVGAAIAVLRAGGGSIGVLFVVIAAVLAIIMVRALLGG